MRNCALIVMCSVLLNVYTVVCAGEPVLKEGMGQPKLAGKSAPDEGMEKPKQRDEKGGQFHLEMTEWVDSRLALLDPDTTRYVLGRMGCTPKSGNIVNSNEGTTREKAPTLVEDIKECKRKKANFNCLATIKLVKDLGVAENMYYAYCVPAK